MGLGAWLQTCRVAAAGIVASLGLLWASPGHADVAPPPMPINVDERGVDVTSGKLVITVTDLSIGPADHHGLRLTRQLVNIGWRLADVPTITGDSTNPVVSYNGHSIPFTTSGSAYVPVYQNGATLSSDRTTLTDSDGTVILFSYVGYQDLTLAGNLGYGTKITYPDATVWDYFYDTMAVPIYQYWCDPYYGCVSWQVGTNYYLRVASIKSSTGYQIKINNSSSASARY
jgi:hypothetical protein